MDKKTRQIIRVYDLLSKKYDKAFLSEKDDSFLNDFIEKLNKNDNILELGSGTGYYSFCLTKNGMKVEAIDLSGEMIKLAKSRYHEIKFIKKDFRDLKYKKNSFDGVWAGYSLFYVNRKDFLKIIKKIKNLLKPGGIFGLTMQEGQGEMKMQDPLLPNEDLYFWLYTEFELQQILKESDFNTLNVRIKDPRAEYGDLPFRKIFLLAKNIK